MVPFMICVILLLKATMLSATPGVTYGINRLYAVYCFAFAVACNGYKTTGMMLKLPDKFVMGQTANVVMWIVFSGLFYGPVISYDKALFETLEDKISAREVRDTDTDEAAYVNMQ